MDDRVVIKIDGLVKSYGEIKALRGVNLQVRRGEIYGFLGPNGAGKTTTIRCMLDLIRPQGGSIQLLGLDPQAEPVAVRSRIGYLPGELNLEANLKVEAALRYFDSLRGSRVDWSYVRELSERLDLDLGMPIKNLSKGNKQKVGVIQALMHKPDLLLMDEPTSGLDPLIQQQVYRILREAQAAGTTLFFSSHFISEVETIADRVAIIRKGVIVEEAKPNELISMVMRRLRVRFREAVDPTPLIQLEGVTLLSQGEDGLSVTLQVEGEMDSLSKTLATYPIVDFETERPSLEEIFLAYYEDSEAEDQEHVRRI
jgi:ABC-2 type transport system ATP-binding protein